MDTERAEEDIRKIVLKHVPNDCSVLLFGSRTDGSARKWSDFDVGIDCGYRLDLKVIGLINEELDNSSIPYKVDVVDLSRTSEDFKENAIKGAKLWRKKS